jgi:alpha-glucosidase
MTQSELARRVVSPTAWWRDAVVYQVYVKSFADSDGDGIGDIDGITSRLPYLVELGVDGIWLSPCYPTPDRDGGYDVADYMRIADVYGGTGALDRLLAGAHELGLRVLLDIVPNHCSSEHPWFQQALREAPGGEHRRRFLFREGRGPDGAEPPNNWQSIFGGPAWTQVREADGTLGEWYLHLFDSSQPDFDWRNPAVAEHFEDVLRYWFDRGVDGFRIDVAHGLLKEADLPDVDPAGTSNPMAHHADVHEVYRSWRAVADGYLPQRELVFVGEAWAPDALETAAYIRGDELHTTFGFDLLTQRWSAPRFHESIERSLAAVAAIAGSDEGVGVIAWTLNNHDVHRSVSRYGVQAASAADTNDFAALARPHGEVDRAFAAALFTLCLPGSVYLYQGEELGLPEVVELPDDARQDPIWVRSGRTDPGRDGSRVPLPWTEDAPSFGFSPREARMQPWLPQPAFFADYAVSRQAADPGSTLWLYRDALRLRRELLEPASGELEWLPTGREDDVLAYRRGALTVACVFGPEPYTAPDAWGALVLTSGNANGRTVPGPATAWFLR